MEVITMFNPALRFSRAVIFAVSPFLLLACGGGTHDVTQSVDTVAAVDTPEATDIADALLKTQDSGTANKSGGTTYYVDETNGKETNNGLSATTPFKYLSTAAGKTAPGDTVKLLPGTYRNFGAANAFNGLYVPNSGSPGKYITYSGVTDANGKWPVIESSALSAFTMQSRSYIIIENLEFRAAKQDYLNIKGTIGDYAWTERTGVRIQDDSYNIIVRRNRIYDFPGAGVAVSSSDVVLVQSNTVEHNAWGSRSGTSGISFYKMTDQPNATRFSLFPNHGVIIYNNISRYNTQLVGSQAFDWKLTDGNGIIIDDFKHTQDTNPKPYSSASLIFGNRVYGNGGAGINVFQTNSAEVINNSVFDNGQTRRTQSRPANLILNQAHQPVQVGGSANTLVANNIFVRSDIDTEMISQFWNDTATVRFKNNIFWNTVGQVGTVPAENKVADPQWSNAKSLTQAQTNLFATVEDIYNAKGAATLVRQPTRDNGFPIHNLSLLASSPAINAGLDLKYRKFSGSGVDIGAVEYTAP
jgi:hypothetical protein